MKAPIDARPLRAVVYARRSQEHQEESAPRQVALAKAFVERKGWKLVDVYADDQGHAGRKEFKTRIEFNRLLADSALGKFDVVVCRDLSRLGGDTARTMLAIETMKEDGVSIFYYVDGSEQLIETWIDKTMLAIRSGAAEGERDAISSRTREALQQKAQQALCVGGRCYGYTLIPILEGSVKKRTEYIVNPEEVDLTQ